MTVRQESSVVSPQLFLRLGFLVFILWMNVSLSRSPSARSSASWFADGGFTLNTVENSLHGKQLYVDSFYQYGSLPIGLYTFISHFLGNTVATFSYYLLAVHILFTILVLIVLAVARCDLVTTALTLLALCPFVIAPSGLQYSYEQLFTLAVMVVWQAPAARSPGRSMLLGLLLGAMQWVRFGSPAGLILGVAAVDLLSLYVQEGGLSRNSFKQLLKQGAFILGGFLAVESALLIQLYLTLPHDVAQDVAWPYYMSGSFNVYAPQDRHPRFLSLHYFLGQQLTPVVGFLCAAFFAGAQLFSSRSRKGSLCEHQTAYRFLIPFVAYLANASFFYQQVWHYYKGAWLLVIAAVCVLRYKWVPLRVALAMLFVPCAFVALRPASKSAPASTMVRTTTPNGELLWVPPIVLARTENLVAVLARLDAGNSPTSVGKGFIILERQPITVSAYLHFFYRVPQAIRHTMIFPGWLRPRDLRQIEENLINVVAIVLLQKPEQGLPPKDICQWNTYQFPKDFCAHVSAMLLDPIPVDGASWIFPVKSQSGDQ
jgi:hypothetical protein